MSLLTKECNLLFYYTATAVHEIDRRSMNGHGAALLTYWATALHEEVAPADSEWLGAASLTYTATAVHEIDRRSMNGHGAALLTYWATALLEEVAPADSEWAWRSLTTAPHPLHLSAGFHPEPIFHLHG